MIKAMHLHSIRDALRPIRIGVMRGIDRFEKIINSFQHSRNIAAKATGFLSVV
jgi:hypothetical protein